MKVAIFAVVVLALAAGVQSSIIPLHTVSSHGGAIVAPGSVAVQAALANGPVSAVAVHSIPHIIAGPVAVAPVAVAPVVGEATYVAKTRGVVHVAPLPGHVQSAASLNLHPAPGTIL